MSNESAGIDQVVRRAASADLAELMAIWRGRDHEQWSRAPEVYRALGKGILGQGEPLLAYDVVREGLNIWTSDVRLRQLQGLALARSGATERANDVLAALRRDGQSDEETLGMLGRTYKDLAMHADSAEREKFLRRAAETYAEAYQATGGYWTGINAATMNLLIGEKERACEIASKVRAQCLKEVKDPSGDQYWEMAALGEAALICRDRKQAEQWYARAAGEGKHRYGDLHSSRRNGRLILEYWNEDQTWLDKYLRVPSVIVFAGHMIDRPDRAMPRFPNELEPLVGKEIRAQIDKLKPGFGFASAACGSDILFLEAMLDAGAEVSIVLPYTKEEFVHDSVDFVPGGKWRARFDRVLQQAARVVTASEQRLKIGGVSYEFCNELLLGLAAISAHQLDTDLVPVAVWNGIPGDGPGGAATVIANWKKFGYEPEVIDLKKLLEGHAPSYPKRGAESVAPSRTVDTAAFTSRIVAILFADAVGFSKLTEPEVPRFVQHFLGAIAQLSKKFQDGIIAKNTWGDGLYFVFSDVGVAGNFALELASLTASTDWEEKGLRGGLNLRIALHAGPVYEFDDPITAHRSYSGTHVSRAARMEPITPPGQVYASEAFAALAAAQRSEGFTCDYVGQTPMAKGYGTLPAYHVRPRSSVLKC
jgi:class 3 adenylate cyclase